MNKLDKAAAGRKLQGMIDQYIERDKKKSQAIELLVSRHNAAIAEVQRISSQVEAWEKWYDAHRMVRFIAKPPRAARSEGHAKGPAAVSIGSPVVTGAMVERGAGEKGSPDSR